MKKWLTHELRTRPTWQLPVAIARSPSKVITAYSNAQRLKCAHQPLFIVGSGRSGNTLLRKLLVENFEIYIPAETYVIPAALFEYLKQSAGWSTKVKMVLNHFENHPEFHTMCRERLGKVYERCIHLPADKQTYGEIIFQILEFMAQTSNCSFELVGDKTPLNTLSLGLISAAFPKARFLFITRDPTDVVSSYLNMKRYTNAGDAARRWSESHKAWFNFTRTISAEQQMLIKYENLVRDHETVLTNIHCWAKLDKRTKPLPHDFFWGDMSEKPHHANTFREVSTGGIGKGANQLDSTQRKVIAENCAWAAIRLGYDVR